MCAKHEILESKYGVFKVAQTMFAALLVVTEQILFSIVNVLISCNMC